MVDTIYVSFKSTTNVKIYYLLYFGYNVKDYKYYPLKNQPFPDLQKKTPGSKKVEKRKVQNRVEIILTTPVITRTVVKTITVVKTLPSNVAGMCLHMLHSIANKQINKCKLEKTLENPLDCKEIQPVHPKGDQSWVFIGRTDVEAETPIL